MRIEVNLPSLGDDDDAVTKGVVAFWLQKAGAALKAGDDLLELTTDKAAFVVPSPESGTLMEYRVSEGDEVTVGDVLCVLEVG
ncbi:MAG: hypothetical protein HYV27_00720 [Candidatus Hydrogenedentes bacterium]|nr:hypothetical protein [Candidatus Hydrogenedentota bacterium]